MKTRVLFVTLIMVVLMGLPHTVSQTVAAAPVNPDASPEARALLNFIHAMYGKRTMSGQMWAPWGIDEIKTVQEITGKLPVIRGQDYINERANKRENKLAIEWWRAGGIPTIMWHWGAPSRGEGYRQSKMTIEIDRCFEAGTAEHTAMWKDLERIADHLTELRDANVPILWRPMHEFDGDWFWYGKGGGERFIQLWRTMFDYFVKERGLNNLIWVLCHSGRPKADWNPGKDYYDLAGPDNYGKGIQESLFNTAKSIHGDTIPIPYHECGTIPDPDESFKQNVTWSWWMLWHTGHLTRHNRDALTRAYNHELIMTRDELPSIMDYLKDGMGVTPAGPKSAEKETVKSDDRPGEMVAIPSGSFLMGNNGHEGFGGPEEFPQHSVYLSTYQIGKYEVTRGQYRRFIEAGGYDDPSYWSAEGWKWKESDVIVYAGMQGTFRETTRPNKEKKRNQPQHWEPEQEWIGHGYNHPVFIQTDEHPVVGVTYYEAEAYCKWAGGRLPTEAEWEKAARWEPEKQHANIWPWGDTWDPEKCNNPEDHNPAGGGYRTNQSAPVGSYPEGAGPYGCMDMVGNAYEWVADWAKSYPGNTKPFAHNDYHFVRGGCWDDGPFGVRCAYRGWYLPPSSGGVGPGDSDYIGFRVAR